MSATNDTKLIQLTHEPKAYSITYDKDKLFWTTIQDNLAGSSGAPAGTHSSTYFSDFDFSKCKDNIYNDSTITDKTKKNTYDQVCENKNQSSQAEKIQTIQRGADSRYEDALSSYDREYLQSWNLGLGSVFILFNIYRIYIS